MSDLSSSSLDIVFWTFISFFAMIVPIFIDGLIMQLKNGKTFNNKADDSNFLKNLSPEAMRLKLFIADRCKEKTQSKIIPQEYKDIISVLSISRRTELLPTLRAGRRTVPLKSIYFVLTLFLFSIIIGITYTITENIISASVLLLFLSLCYIFVFKKSYKDAGMSILSPSSQEIYQNYIQNRQDKSFYAVSDDTKLMSAISKKKSFKELLVKLNLLDNSDNVPVEIKDLSKQLRNCYKEFRDNQDEKFMESLMIRCNKMCFVVCIICFLLLPISGSLFTLTTTTSSALTAISIPFLNNKKRRTKSQFNEAAEQKKIAEQLEGIKNNDDYVYYSIGKHVKTGKEVDYFHSAVWQDLSQEDIDRMSEEELEEIKAEGTQPIIDDINELIKNNPEKTIFINLDAKYQNDGANKRVSSLSSEFLANTFLCFKNKNIILYTNHWITLSRLTYNQSLKEKTCTGDAMFCRLHPKLKLSDKLENKNEPA